LSAGLFAVVTFVFFISVFLLFPLCFFVFFLLLLWLFFKNLLLRRNKFKLLMISNYVRRFDFSLSWYVLN
jgi:hypothetical protein